MHGPRRVVALILSHYHAPAHLLAETSNSLSNTVFHRDICHCGPPALDDDEPAILPLRCRCVKRARPCRSSATKNPMVAYAHRSEDALKPAERSAPNRRCPQTCCHPPPIGSGWQLCCSQACDGRRRRPTGELQREQCDYRAEVEPTKRRNEAPEDPQIRPGQRIDRLPHTAQSRRAHPRQHDSSEDQDRVHRHEAANQIHGKSAHRLVLLELRFDRGTQVPHLPTT